MKGVLLNKTVYNRGHGTASLSVTGSYFDGKKILVGVTAGAAICKATEFVRRLRESALRVDVVMTQNATRLVSPQLFNAVTDMYDGNSMRHMDWQKYDLICVVPATANFIGKTANGIADDLLTTTVLAYKGPVLVAPAMNTAMWENSAVQENVSRLKKRGFEFCGPEKGMLACGDNGWGRMSEVAKILAYAERILAPKDLKGKNVLVTAGSTREMFDDVRFMANGSSGRMGYSFAKEAWIRGASVWIVVGHVDLEDPYDMRVEKVVSAEDMFKAVKKHFKWCDYFVSAAAVADFRPVQRVRGKIVKKDGLDVSFTENVDILKWCGANKKRGQKIIGFAIGDAREKFLTKKCDFLVENDVANVGALHGECVLIGRVGEKSFSGTKGEMAKGVWDEVL
ncbi:MAG: bifunctional phosphopantothenoylcysteine decarboxylase/phosphopantothenate--cysteine ligase CoaBC [Candidatus Gracilibacteria bacterium]|jgi:phosphopantothenoylcysteine decarboxylase/phosphopantothenate--cysteine ligase